MCFRRQQAAASNSGRQQAAAGSSGQQQALQNFMFAQTKFMEQKRESWTKKHIFTFMYFYVFSMYFLCIFVGLQSGRLSQYSGTYLVNIIMLIIIVSIISIIIIIIIIIIIQSLRAIRRPQCGWLDVWRVASNDRAMK